MTFNGDTDMVAVSVTPVVEQPTDGTASGSYTDVHAESQMLSGEQIASAVAEGVLGSAHADGVSTLDDAHLLSQADPSKRKMIWIVHGVQDVTLLSRLLDRISPCSMLINILWAGLRKPLPVRPQEIRSLLRDPRLQVAIPCQPRQQARAVNKLVDVEAYLGWKPLLPSNAGREGLEHLRDFYDEFRAFLNSKAVFRKTQVYSSHLFLGNALVNMVFAGNGSRLESFREVHQGKPALIVATGPSLNKQLDLLAKNRDLFLVIAVDPAVPILKKIGVRPDIVCSVDPKKRPYWGPDGLDPQTCLAIDIGVCPDVAWASQHKYLITSCNPPVQRFVSALGGSASPMSAGGSVATSAFNLAHHMGANPIVMIGQDLAWTDGKDHADGYVSQYSRDALEARYKTGFDVEGYHGGQVRTERQLMYYKGWFEQRIRQMPSTRVVNATEGGARIVGAEQVPFSKICEQIRQAGLFSAPKIPGEPWKLDSEYCRELVKCFEGMHRDLDMFGKKISKAITAINNSKGRPNNKLMSLVDEINRDLRDGNWKIKTIIEFFAQAPITEARTKMMRDGIRANLNAVFKEYAKIYDASLTGVSAGKDILLRLINLYQGIAESGKPSLDILREYKFNRWNADGSSAIN